MIDKISYEDFESIIKMLDSSNSNIKEIVNACKEKEELATLKIERFNQELDKYIEYLKSILQINKDADTVLERIKKMNF